MPSTGESAADTPAKGSGLRFELLLALSLVLFGLVVLPALIYFVGVLLLGEYAGGGHLGSFYGDILRDLGQGSPQAWILVLGPLLLTQVGRLIFLRFGTEPATRDQEPSAPARAPGKANVRERREPTLKL